MLQFAVSAFLETKYMKKQEKGTGVKATVRTPNKQDVTAKNRFFAGSITSLL
jgi:hypothetical protein